MDNQEPQQHRSIQDIIPPARSKPIRQAPPPNVPPPPPSPPTPPRPLDMQPNKPKGIGIIIAFVVILILAGAAFWIVSTFFHRAYVSVTPNVYTATIETSLEASLETAAEPKALAYRNATAEETATKTVAASGSEQVEKRASGVITVYNAFSTQPERFVTNTRFQTKDGLIFKVHTPVTIPGYTMKAGVKVPGTIDVTVYADEPGEKYNVGLQDFTVPGLKGSQQFDLMYAKSKTPMSGGFVGLQAVVDPSVRSQAVAELQATLERNLREKLLEEGPKGYLIFGDTVSVMYAEAADAVDGTNALISVTGTASAPAFNESSFARALAGAGGVAADGDLSIENPNELAVHVSSPDLVGTDSPLTVTIAGLVKLVGAVDPVKLAEDLAGRNKEAVSGILPGYPGIADIIVKVYPFWMSAIPKDVDDVDIEITGAAEEDGEEAAP